MKKILFNLVFITLISNAFAVVPIINSQDVITMDSYLLQIKDYVDKLQTATSAVNMIKNLRSLQDAQAAASTLCELCNKTEQEQLTTYIDSINTDLCSQFSTALANIDGINRSINSISGIIDKLQTNPQAAALALQQSAIITQKALHSTLVQIQVLQTQQLQKHLAEEKLEKQTSQSVYLGFRQAKL